MSLKRFFVAGSALKNNIVEITGAEHNHLKNVLRFSVGSEIVVTCGNEFDYICEITAINKNMTTANVKTKELNIANPKTNITVFQAVVKNDNMNLIIQKLTEIGVTKIVPFVSQFSTVKEKFGKNEKWQQISIQSTKQCKRSVPVIIENTVNINKIYDMLKNYNLVLFANEQEQSRNLNDVLAKNKNAKSIAIIIGNEGGFSEDEIINLNKVANSVTLGKRILRAETAAIVLSGIAAFSMGEFNK